SKNPRIRTWNEEPWNLGTSSFKNQPSRKRSYPTCIGLFAKGGLAPAARVLGFAQETSPMNRLPAVRILWLVGALFCSRPAFAQFDFAGQWVPLFHEDYPDRLPGPELGDYTGLPINDAARLRADSWDADRISVVSEYQCRP